MTVAAVIAMVAALLLAVRALSAHHVPRGRLALHAVVWAVALAALAFGFDMFA